MKSYELFETKHPDLFRVVDRDGKWEHYFHKPSGTYLRGVTSILNQGYPKGQFFEQWLSQKSAQERDEILSAAGERGDKVHRAIDKLLSAGKRAALSRDSKIFSRSSEREETIAPQEWDALLAFSRFWNAHDPILYVSEAPTYSLRHGYAGTADAIFAITKACGVKTCKCEELLGKIGLWDWKTSSGIRASYSAQMAAYACAENIGEYLPADKVNVEYVAVLRIGTNHKTTGGYEMKSYDIMEAFNRFHSALTLAEYENAPFTADEIVTIPDRISIVVTRPKKPRKARTKEASKETAPVDRPKKSRKLKNDNK